MNEVSDCALCCGSMSWFADGMVLDHVPVRYLRCDVCGSVMLPNPTWLEEAYSHAISPLDVGLLERCVQMANITTAVVLAQGLRRGRFLDFAGGYGTLTRLMRDRGLDFRHDDPFCENLFAQGFEAEVGERQDLVTAYEVLEHLSDPAASLAAVAGSTDLLLATTRLLPAPVPQPGEWDYYAEESGQHITFYTVAGLRALGGKLGMQLTTSGRTTHLFHRGPLRAATKALLRDERVAYAVGALESEVARRRGRTVADRAEVVASLQAARRTEGDDAESV
jgi:Methyltransferase domain